MIWVGIVVGTVMLGVLLYWLLVTTEGVFLGQRIVIWLYDLTATRYDSIKEFSESDDGFFIARPMIRILGQVESPIILDVATGTGRVPFTLMRQPDYSGFIVGLDASESMLAQAQSKMVGTSSGREQTYALVRHLAAPLPFPDNAFDMVSCLEALEFFPSAEQALIEMVRVLKPGCAVITSRRRGKDARLYLSHYRSKSEFEEMLSNAGFVDIQSSRWELDYEMVTAKKA
jgi:SAM-dependent methyltransferase